MATVLPHLVEPEHGTRSEGAKTIEVPGEKIVIVVPRPKDVVRLVEDATLQLKAIYKNKAQTSLRILPTESYSNIVYGNHKYPQKRIYIARQTISERKTSNHLNYNVLAGYPASLGFPSSLPTSDYQASPGILAV